MSQAKTVLIVDDDVVFADFLRASVESVGHRAVIVTSGNEAVDSFLLHRPDLVMLDILLPGSDGFQLCQDIRASEGGADVPIALMTGIYKKAAYERQGLADCGANEYLHKPLGVQAFWRLLEKHLGELRGDAEAAPPPDGADLSQVPLVEVLAEQVAADANGVLFVRSPGATHAIYLQWGEPVFIRTNDPADRLDEVLRRTATVSEEDIEQAMQTSRLSCGRLRLGQALVRRGVLSEEQFQSALQLQLRLVFQKAFALQAGSCSFIPGSHPTEEDVLLAIRPRALLFLGAQAAKDHPALAGTLPGSAAPLLRAGDFCTRIAELSLKAHERALAEMADGTLTVGRFQAIAESAGCDAAALLRGFLTTGLLDAGEAAASTAPHRPQTEDSDWDAGRFSRLPVAAAIADLYRATASGTLEVRAKKSGPAKRIVFHEGAIVAVQSDVDEDRLDEMLVKLELITEDELVELMDSFGAAEPDDRELARALSTSGDVLPLQIYWAAVYQAQAAVESVFPLKGARLRWSAGEEPPGTVALPDLPSTEIVWNATRSLPTAALHALLPPKTAWLHAAADSAARAKGMPLDQAERDLLERLQRPTRLDSLLDEAGEARDALRHRLFGLYSTHLATACTGPGPGPSADDIEEALGRLASTASSLAGEGQGLDDAEPAVSEAVGVRSEDAFAVDLEVESGEPDRGPENALATEGRELVGRLAAAREQLASVDGAPPTEELAALLQRCEEHLRSVLEESGAEQREPAGATGSR